MRSRWWVAMLLVVPLLGGCGTTEEEANQDLLTEEVVVREGDYDLARDNGGGQPYTAVAVVGARAFLAKGYEGIHVLDLRTMRVTQRLRTDTAGRRIVASGMQSLGRSGVLFWHQGDSYTNFDDNRQYLHLQWFSPSSMRVTRALSIDLTGTYESRDGVLNDLPSLNAHFDSVGGRYWLSFNHTARATRIVSFTLPAASVGTVRLEALPGFRSFAVENPHDVVVSGQTAYVASSSDGVRAVDLRNGRQRVVAGDVGYAVQMAVAGERGFVADHDGNLRVLNLSDGETLATREVPGFVDGVTVAGGSVWVTWRNGVSVIRNRWTR